MFRQFPTLFREENRENLLVFVDKGRVVCHIGLTLNTLCLAGCLVHVACAGAVATAEAWRGRGLASALLEHAAAHARQHGALLMLISGGRGLYLRAGAAPVGQHVDMLVLGEARSRLHTAGVSVTPFHTAELPAWQALYRAKTARYLRPPEDWTAFEANRLCIGRPVDWWTIRRQSAPCAYCVVEPPREGKPALVHEWAGGQGAMAAAMPALLENYAPAPVLLRVQPYESALRGWLLAAGAEERPPGTDETLLMLDAVGLVECCWPHFEEYAGRATANRLLAAATDAGGLILQLNGEHEQVCNGPADAARFLFGSPGHPGPGPVWDRFLPIPMAAYGLNFI